MRHSDSLYYFEDGYCGGCGLTDRGLPCAAAECLFLTCGDEECDDGATFFTYDDDSTVATNYTDADTLTLSSRSVMTKGFPRRGVGGYSNYRKDGVGDRISQRLQKIDERNEALEMEPMTTGLSCLSAAADHGNASNIPMTIAPLPTVEEGSEEREITAVEPMMHGGEASAASKSGSGTVIPHSNTMFSARSAKSSKSTKTEKTSTSARSFPGALMVAKAGTKLRSAKLPDVKMPEAKLKQRMLALHMATMGLASPRPKQQRKASGIIGANGGSVEVVDLDRRNDRAVKQDTCATKVPSLFGGEIDISDERDSFAGVDTSTSENGKMTTMKTASGAMGSALTVLNVKKMKTRHDTVKRANAIEVEARKYSDRGQWDIAERKYEESLRIKKEVLPKGHVEITKALDLLAMARIEQSDYAGAIDPVEEALEVRRKAKGGDDLSVVSQLHSLAFLCRISGNTAKLAEVNKEIGKVCKVPAM